MASGDPAETAAYSLFADVGRAGVCALLRAEFAIDYRFVDDRTLLAMLARAYRLDALPLPSDAGAPFESEWVDVDIQGLGRLLLADKRLKAGYTPLLYDELPDARAVVERLVAQPEAREVVAAALEAQGRNSVRAAPTDRALRAGLLAALESGVLVLLRPDTSGSGLAKTQAAASPPPPPTADPKPLPRPARTVLHWIEIGLVDDDGAPLAGETYEITLPSGELRTGSLDGDGKARLDGLTEGGSAKISFPAIDAREWRLA